MTGSLGIATDHSVWLFNIVSDQ